MKVNVDETSSVPDQNTVCSTDLDFGEIDFDGLTTDQNEQAIKMLREKSDLFAKSDDETPLTLLIPRAGGSTRPPYRFSSITLDRHKF